MRWHVKQVSIFSICQDAAGESKWDSHINCKWVYSVVTVSLSRFFDQNTGYKWMLLQRNAKNAISDYSAYPVAWRAPPRVSMCYTDTDHNWDCSTCYHCYGCAEHALCFAVVSELLLRIYLLQLQNDLLSFHLLFVVYKNNTASQKLTSAH